MRELTLNGVAITQNSKPYVIAEIGHNHMGSMEVCKELITAAAAAGADAVKLQKRHNKTLFTEEFYNVPYRNPASFGATYGEHRENLELSETQYRDLFEFATRTGITFFATPFDNPSLDFLDELGVPFFKVQSADIHNLRFIEQVCEKKKPVIFSTGGANYNDIRQSARFIIRQSVPFALLHCTALYPARAPEINLGIIARLLDEYRDIIIGFSSHYDGILASIGAYMAGARIIEQHFTLRHTNKGSDHALSLQPAGLAEMTHYLSELFLMQGAYKEHEQVMRERTQVLKLAKSLYFTRDIAEGEVVTWQDVALKSPQSPKGFSIKAFYDNYGQIRTTTAYKKGEIFPYDNIN